MIKILRSEQNPVFEQGPFKVRRIRPGLIDTDAHDNAFGPFSVMDHANLGIGTVVRMHEHVNDEILSYMWRGTMVHQDSAGHRAELTPRKLMMMNAGRSFWHEESTPDGPVEMLQIFFRPREADLEGVVTFFDRSDDIPDGQWTLIAAPNDAPLRIRQTIVVHDARLTAGKTIALPPTEGLSPWLYVMDGAIRIGSDTLGKGDAAAGDDLPWPQISATMPTTLVLFLVDRVAPASLAGTISGWR